MGDTRIRYGLAFGKQNNFYSGISGQKGYLAGTDGLFAQASTGPDVTTGVLFYTNNSAATTINRFELSHPSVGYGNLAGLYEGKTIKIIFLDSNTTVAGSAIYLASSDNTFNSQGYLELLYHGSAWYETTRSNPKNFVTIAAAGSSSFNTNFVDTIYITGTATPVVITSLSGGVVGQRIVLTSNSGNIVYQINTNGNIVLANTSAVSLAGATTPAGGACIMLQKTTATTWSPVNGGW